MIFVSFLESTYSRSSVYYSQLKAWNREVFFKKIEPGIYETLRNVLQIRKQEKTIVVVMSPSHVLVIWFKLLTKHQIVLDAGWSLTESTTARKKNQIRFIRRLKIYVVDFVASHLANLIFVESLEQVNFYIKNFRINRNKIECLYTGFNELEFKERTMRCPNELSGVPIQDYFTILFRGKINEETGLEKILALTQAIKNSKVKIIIATPDKIEVRFPTKNTVIINRYIDPEEMVYLYRHADVSLGQLGNTPRIQNTIPHKVFESIYFAVPIILIRTKALSEIFPNEEFALFIEHSNGKELASIINRVMKKDSELSKIRKKYRQIYLEILSQKALTEKFENLIINKLS